MADSNGNEGQLIQVDMKEKEQYVLILAEMRKLKEELRLNDVEDYEIRFYDNCQLNIKGKKIECSIIETTYNKDVQEKDKAQELKRYDVFMEYKGELILIGQINEQDLWIPNEEFLIEIDKENLLGLRETRENEYAYPELLDMGKSPEDLEKDIEKIEKNDKEGKNPEENNPKSNKFKGIEIFLDQKVDTKYTLREYLNISSEYSELYAMMEDGTVKIKGYNSKDGKLEEISNLKQTKGESPTKTILTIDKDDVEEQSYDAIYYLGGYPNERGLAAKYSITKGMEVRRIQGTGTGEEIADSGVPKSNTLERNPNSETTQDLMSHNEEGKEKIAEAEETFLLLKNLEDKDLPPNADPSKDYIQIEEIVGIDELIKNMANEISKEKGYSMEDSLKIVEKVVYDGENYKTAEEDVIENSDNVKVPGPGSSIRPKN